MMNLFQKNNKYDLVIVGSGFASSFFLLEYLKHAPENARILVLEKGAHNKHSWQLNHKTNSSTNSDSTFQKHGKHDKKWVFNIGFGGGSNCWWACTPRFLPSDFKMRSLYGVGEDWPLSYEDLAPFYSEAEHIMQISGPDDYSIFPEKINYPLPPHIFNAPDKILKKAYPDLYYNQPTARASIATDKRPQCCGNGVCRLCPIDAKFTIENGLYELYRDKRVKLMLEAEVESLDIKNGEVSQVHFRHGGK